MATNYKGMIEVDSKDQPASLKLAQEESPQYEEAVIKKISHTSQIMSILVSGIALFSDGYNAQIIGYMEPFFSTLYGDAMSKTIKTRLSNSYLIGEIVGMLLFGYVIDKMGRRFGIVIATFLLVLGIILATAAHGYSQLGLFWMMIIGRGIAGVGAGGEYPVCGTSSTEAADETPRVRRRRGILVAIATDFSIDLGFVVAGIVALIVLAAFNQNTTTDGVWRVCFGLGIVLPLTVFFFRIRMINSTQYRRHAIKKKIPYLLAIKKYWKPMLGTSLAWFCYDFVTYPFGIYSSTIISQLNPNNTVTQNIGYGTVVNCFYLPGTIVGGLLMDRIGRKQTMTLGFVLWGILGFILGGAIRPIQSVFPLFVVLYGIFNAFGEMGPGVATFLVGSESFPTPLRGHFLGFAAAVGKAGAAIGTQVFTPIQDSFSSVEKGQQGVFLIGSAFAIVGALITWFLIPDKSRDLESEDRKFREYLAEHGYEAEFGESIEKQVANSAFRLERAV